MDEGSTRLRFFSCQFKLLFKMQTGVLLATLKLRVSTLMCKSTHWWKLENTACNRPPPPPVCNLCMINLPFIKIIKITSILIDRLPQYTEWTLNANCEIARLCAEIDLEFLMLISTTAVMGRFGLDPNINLSVSLA